MFTSGPWKKPPHAESVMAQTSDADALRALLGIRWALSLGGLVGYFVVALPSVYPDAASRRTRAGPVGPSAACRTDGSPGPVARRGRTRDQVGRGIPEKSCARPRAIAYWFRSSEYLFRITEIMRI